MKYVSRYLVKKKKKIQKIAEITLTATKIGYSNQFGIFGKIDGSRKSQKPQINLLIDFHFLLTNCKRKKNAFFQTHECTMFELSYLEWNIFQLPSASRNQSQTQALEKTGRLVIGPLWKNITYTSFGFKIFTKIGIFIAHTISLALSKNKYPQYISNKIYAFKFSSKDTGATASVE